MRVFLLFSFGLGCFNSMEIYGQKLTSLKPKNPIICYQTIQDDPDHVAPPETFQHWRKNRSARLKTANIEVEYINFPADNQAKTAFQFAVDIWETELKSSVPIKVRAQWATLSSGTLGQAIWGTAIANFDGAQHLNTFYPVALAEKMAGRELNVSSEPDIVATFNSNANWYFGTDGGATAGKMDLVTIVLHEIAHGLGFTDTYNVNGTQGSVGLQNGGNAVPFAFDLFVENAAGQNLFTQFVSPSANLKTQLTAGNLFYNTPLAVAATGARPKLYAPDPFNDGSSIAHLDESTYTTPGDANKLMTPQIAPMETIHNPGSILRGIFSDMGWVFTKIEHEPLTDTERQDGAPYLVKAIIKSDNGYQAGTVKLHYTLDNVNFTEVAMTATGVPNEFQAALPGTTVNKSYGYFISVLDIINRTFTKPGKMQEQNKPAKQDIIVFDIGPDTKAPEIVHAPVDYVFEGETQLEIVASVTDNIGVGSVSVEYSINEGAFQTKPMIEVSGDEYSATIDLPPGLVIGNKIKYRIIARDNSSGLNQATSPSTDYYIVFVTGIMPTQNSYINDFNEPSIDFIGNSFNITTPAGFASGAVHSKHPYDNGSGPNDESNYIYQLQIPIRINAGNPFIQFDEIGLIEPGESGSVFGDSDFYDYAVVEGSKDGGTTWIPFADGYDARAYNVWLTRYNSEISNDNSQATGDPSLFRERTINMLESGDFAANDEVLIRFRLFADQAAHGWGWAIDDLSIQGDVTGIEQARGIDFKAYPNPAKESITVEWTNSPSSNIDLHILDAQGKSVYQQNIPNEKQTIDITSLPNGLYLIKAGVNGKLVMKKFLKIN